MDHYPKDYFNEFNEFGENNKIKPKLLAKMPFAFYKNKLEELDLFVDYSPGLGMIKNKGCLTIVVKNRSTMFFTDCADCFKDFEGKFTDNTAVCNLVVFSNEISKRSKLNNPDPEDEYFDDEMPVIKPPFTGDVKLSKIYKTLYDRRKKDNGCNGNNNEE